MSTRELGQVERMRRACACFVAALLLLVASSVCAQQASSNMGPDFMDGRPGTYAIRNAHIVTVSGADIESGTIVIRDGRIQAVGANASVPAGAQTIEGRGLTVYPGMIDLGTAIGLIEITENGATGWIDTEEVGEMNPNSMAWVSVNPHSAHIAVTRLNGVTSVLSLPQGGTISGQAAFLNLLGSTPEDMALVRNAGLVVNFPRAAGGFGGGGGFFAQQQGNISDAITARDRQIEQLRKLLRDAEAYGRAQDAANQDRSLPHPDVDVVLASLVPYVRGERPVIFRVDRESEIRGAVRFAEELKLKPIIVGANDAWKVAQFLKDHNVPVVLTGTLDLPSREDDFYDVQYENAAKLQAAGVRFCISSGDTAADVRNLPYHAGMAAAFGLSKAEALKAVTLYPAQIMGLGDRLGSIEVGKIANLVLTDGDLLETRTNIRDLFINGRRVPLVSRHTELYEQFKNRK
ncbi:MAG: amidohydrolase family protein [Pyrinomonadaceae bacterium]